MRAAGSTGQEEPKRPRLSGPCRAERERILAVEKGSVFKSGRSYPLEVGLIYPNSYPVGTSNLGFQFVYHLFNLREEIRCERFYWDSGLIDPCTNRPVSLEGGRDLSSFSMIAASISFEEDYANLLRMLEAAGIHSESKERGEQEPLVLVGGPCAFMNPEPIAPFVDLFALGAGEALLPLLIEAWFDVMMRAGGKKSDLIDSLAEVDGFYAPEFLSVALHPDGRVRSLSYRGRADPSLKWVRAPGYEERIPRIVSPLAHFADMPLIEVGTGCSRGCRFCAASFIYRPPIKRELDDMKRDIDQQLSLGKGKIGLIGAALSDHPHLVPILEHIERRGGRVGLSSMRLDGVSDDMIRLLARLDVRTLTCAPEAGSQRMRDVIRKALSDEEIIASIEAIGRNRFKTLKLYFMIGLPFEREEDCAAIVDLIRRSDRAIRAHHKTTRISLKINPFVPKPFTPFQWAPMEREGALRKKAAYLERELRGLKGTALKVGSIRKGVFQAILAKGDRRLAPPLLRAAIGGISLLASLVRAGLDPEFYLYRERGEDEIFPWDFINHGFQKRWLVKEFRRARKAASRSGEEGA